MAKQLTLSSSDLRHVSLNCTVDDAGVVTNLVIKIIGVVKDSAGNEIKTEGIDTEVIALNPGPRSDVNGLMREFSEMFNEQFADEASSTWIDL